MTMPATPRTSGMAIASLSLGIAGVVLAICLFFLPILPILATILGYLARAQIRRDGLAGNGMAITGIVLGYVGLAASVLVIALIAVGSFTSPTSL